MEREGGRDRKKERERARVKGGRESGEKEI